MNNKLQVVRAPASSRCHVARVADDDIITETMFGAKYQVVGFDYVATICGVLLRTHRGPVVIMRRAKVNCRSCAHFSDITEVSDGR